MQKRAILNKKEKDLGFNNSFSNMSSLKHFNKSLWNIFESISVRFMRFDFCLLHYHLKLMEWNWQ